MASNIIATSISNSRDSTCEKQSCRAVAANLVESTEVDSIKYLDKKKIKLLYDIGNKNEDKYLHSLTFSGSLVNRMVHPDCTTLKLC